MRRHRDDPKEPTLSVGENYARAEQLVASSWIYWISIFYFPVGIYLAFGVHPLRTLFGWPPLGLLVVLEMFVWIAAPLIAGMALHCWLAKPRAGKS